MPAAWPTAELSSLGGNRRLAEGRPGGPLMERTPRHARPLWRSERRKGYWSSLLTVWTICAIAGAVYLLLGGILGKEPAAVLAVLLLQSACIWCFWRELRLAHRVNQAGNRLCLHCRYDLRDLDNADGECPECGAAYNLPELSEAWNHLIPPWRRALAQCIFGRQA